MSAIPYLNNRQIDAKSRSGFTHYYPNLNFDNVLSRLACHKDDIFTVRGEEADVPPFSCKFRRDGYSDLLAIANEDGDITVYDTTKRYPDNLRKSFTAHHNAVFDICWVPDKCHLISGSGDHNAALWDITCCKLISIFKNHKASIKSVDVCQEQSAIFATGSRDGSINVWDVREKNTTVDVKPAVCITQAHCRKNTVYNGKKNIQKDPVSSVSAVAFQNVNTLASAGVADGVVKVWDLRRTYIPNSKYIPSPKYRMNYSESGSRGHGCTSLVFDSRYRNLYACSTNNQILKFNCHSYAKEGIVYEGFRCATYFVKLALSSDDQYLLCGSSDDKAYIWKTSKPGLPFMQLAVHSAEVTSVCWSSHDITKLATCGDDNKVAIWKIAGSETVKVNDNIVAVVEPYCECPKNDNDPFQNTVQNSITAFNILNKISPVQSNPTPTKLSPIIRAITSFFSPITASSMQKSKDIQNQAVTANGSDSTSPASKLLNKSPTSDTSPQVLAPSNHINKNNIMHQSLDDTFSVSESLSSLELKNSSPENKNCGTSFLSSSSSVQNKENTSKNLGSESLYRKNSIGQTKRKSTSKNSTPNLKRKQTESSKKTKGLAKMDKKTPPGKTIMNYFSVALSSDN